MAQNTGSAYAVEHLTREHVIQHQRNHAGRTDSFRPDDRLPHDQRAELSDYKRSGYDRGHMAPDADSWDAESEYDTFVLSNMVPQAPDNNRELHAHIEGAVRHLAKQEGELYVYTGPVFQGNTQYLDRRVAEVQKPWALPSVVVLDRPAGNVIS